MPSDYRKLWRHAKKYSEAMKGRPTNLNLGPLLDSHMKEYKNIHDASYSLDKAIDKMMTIDRSLQTAFESYAKAMMQSRSVAKTTGKWETEIDEGIVLDELRDIAQKMVDDLHVTEGALDPPVRELRKCKAMLMASKARMHKKG